MKNPSDKVNAVDDTYEKPRKFRDRSKKRRGELGENEHPLHQPYAREHKNWTHTAKLQDNLRLLDMIQETATELDSVDFNWLDDNAILNIALDYDKVKQLTEDSIQALVWELGRRLDNYLNGEDDAAPF
jgi:hypothetical protein